MSTPGSECSSARAAARNSGIAKRRKRKNTESPRCGEDEGLRASKCLIAIGSLVARFSEPRTEGEIAMATQQGTAQQKRSGGRKPERAAPERAGRERDEVYGLLSVMYHALKGAETYSTYVRDAERADDEELADFFEQCCDEEMARADRAKELLGDRIRASDSDEPDDDEDDEDKIDDEED
jgi:hypothetical protein